MLILLPPSEGKAAPATRGKSVDLERLSFPELGQARLTVAKALSTLCAQPQALAVLGVSPGLAPEVERNQHVLELPARPASQVYTGVLYAAAGLEDLPAASVRLARRSVVTVSGLWGAVRPQDKIAPYRLAMGVDLPGPGRLASFWRAHLDPVLTSAAGRRGVIVDCRSDTYVAAWTPRGDLAARSASVRVVQDGPSGRKVVSHMAKHTRGEVTRELLLQGADPRSVPELAEVLRARWQVETIEPAKPGAAWTLTVVLPG